MLEARTFGPGPGGRRRDDGRRRAARLHDVRHARASVPGAVQRDANLLDGGAPFYATLCLRRRQVHRRRRHRAAVLCAAAGAERAPAIRSSTQQWRQAGWPELKRQIRRAVRHPHARRMVRAAGRDGRLLRARARHGRGAAPPAQCGARHVRRRDGVTQPAPAPRFSRTPGQVGSRRPASRPGCAPPCWPTGAGARPAIETLRRAGVV